MSTKTTETPETSNKYLEFESDDLKNEATLIKEALVASKVDLHSAFGLEKTEVQVDNTEAIAALQKIHIATGKKIEELGGEITSKQSSIEQSPAEKQVYAELEKLHASSLSAKTQEVLKLDPDFPVDVIKEASIPTADKVSLMSAMTTVAARQSEAINRVKSEVAAQESETEETAKFSAPETEAKTEDDPEAGAKYLAALQAKFGITETETKEVEN